jgi:hypothetical protein
LQQVETGLANAAQCRLSLDGREDSMSTLRKVHTAFGIALVTTLGIVAGSASAEVAPTLGARSRSCTMSGETATGREWAKLVVVGIKLEEGKTVVECHRERTGGEAPVTAVHCKDASFSKEFGCTRVAN